MKTEALYIHIPFCDSICSYCDFCKVFYNEKMVNDYLDALQKELKAKCKQTYRTIYIGGGTPSSLNDEQLEKLCEIIRPYRDEHTQEITIEVNPESMDAFKLDILKRGGINRLSIGVQTFQNHLLKEIERHHNKEQVLRLIQTAKNKGIDNISIDLMYGLPQQTIEDIQCDLDVVATLPITHISYYSLILEDHTVLKNKEFHPVSSEVEESMNVLIDRSLKECGFCKYEVSNYAKVGYESKHNLVYWHYENYLGVGVSAASKINNELISHSRAINQYLGGKDIEEKEVYTKEETMFNHVMMSLRLTKGLDTQEFEKRYRHSIQEVYGDALKKHLDSGMLVIENHYLKTTYESMKYLNSILVDFLS